MEYYFHWTGKMNQSYILETPERKAVFEAVCDHIGIFTSYRYTFLNRLTGDSKEHKVSHTVTQECGTGIGNMRFSEIVSSRFKIDGVDIWELIQKRGYSLQPRRDGLKVNFDILQNGAPIAYLEAAGANILKDGANSKLGDKLPGKGLFKVSCEESDIDGVFLVCFCLSRVDFC